jgi:Arc/MetJ-type ribon-helix-helix transcriptional regulator
MSLGKFIEEQIRKAVEAGEFDNLEGAGKPLDLNNYFNTPEDLRMGYSVLKSAKVLPEEVDRLKEIGEIREKIKTIINEDEKRKWIKILNEKTLAFDLLMERNKRRKF